MYDTFRQEDNVYWKMGHNFTVFFRSSSRFTGFGEKVLKVLAGKM
jgi:chemotaxis methyl-accepting protein methylase